MIRKLLLVVLLALPLLLGCGLNLPPMPPSPPPVVEPMPPSPPLPSPICAVGQTYGCYHNPGEGWLYACPVYDAAGGVIGVLNVTDPSTCPKKPEPPPPVTSPPISSAPLIADEDLQLVPGDTQKLTWSLTSAAIDRWRSKHPEAWRADGACLSNGPAGIDAAFLAIATELKSVGVVAGQ